ncbi:MAG: hypothetical protein Q8Q23_00350 [bacterium]|nr:hypothetical protein [bacterium]
MHDEFQRVLNLVQKTGDRIVVLDKNYPERSYVIMDFDSYEALINIDEDVDDEYLDDVDYFHEDDLDNMDSGLIEEEEDDLFDAPNGSIDKIDENMDNYGEGLDFWSANEASISDLDNEVDYGTIEQKNTKEKWSIPKDIKNSQNNQEIEENRYYLEEIS